MTAKQIAAREAKLNALPMGPKRWRGEIELRKAKTQCTTYKSPNQNITLVDWLAALKEASVEALPEWAADVRFLYYEGQPDSWVQYYDSGSSPKEAVAEDMTYWD